MEKLIEKQAELYGRISRTVENLKKLGQANITTGAVKAKLDTLEKHWKKFDQNHDDMTTTATSDHKKLPYFSGDQYAVAEGCYENQKGKLLDFLAEPPRASDQFRKKLPPIELPKFSGKYSEWRPFRDLFESMMKNDSSIPAVEKLHYLKGCLSGEPAAGIAELGTTADNFTIAWDNLVSRYDNTRVLVNSHLSNLFSLKTIKTESSQELKQLISCVSTTLGSLRALKRSVESWDDMLVYIIVSKLDSGSLREWENSTGASKEPPTYQELKTFLEKRLQVVEALEQFAKTRPSPQPKPQGNKNHASPSTSTKGSSSSPTVKTHHASSGTTKPLCLMCNQSHFILFCDTFRSKTPEERKSFVLSNKLCLNCLGPHVLKDCKSEKSCQTCQGKHHTMIHGTPFIPMDSLTNKPSPSAQSPSSTSSSSTATAAGTEASANSPRGNAQVSTHVSQVQKQNCSVLLATALVHVKASNGEVQLARALIDPCSETSFISESLAQRLRLPRQTANIPVLGVGAKPSSTTRGSVTVLIQPYFESNFFCQALALVLPKLTSYVPNCRFYSSEWTHLDGIPLADPEFSSSEPIDLLLGAIVYSEVILEGLLKGPEGTPVAQLTQLGWILSGSATSRKNPSSHQLTAPGLSCMQCSLDVELGPILQEFWKQEELVTTTKPLSQDEIDCNSHYARTHSRQGRQYVVRLPLKADVENLGESLAPARRMLQQLERRFEREPNLHDSYDTFMEEYEDLHHMEKVPPPDCSTDAKTYYLPHHGVVRETSSTTKLRVVFNGSQKTSSGKSLNDILNTGPNLLPELSDILLRWRKYTVVFSADIEKMYRQILVHPADRNLQRILWRPKDQADISHYQLNTVTYGLACAPYLAIRTIQQLSHDESKNYPLAAAILQKDIYMDDVLSGDYSEAAALEKQCQLINLLKAGGFILRKWASNLDHLTSHLPASYIAPSQCLSWQAGASFTMLGLTWQPDQDCFTFKIKTCESPAILNKRNVLSRVAQLFDPLGWLSPVIITPKIFMQSLWLLKLGWDDPLPENTAKLWTKIYDDLNHLELIKIPRWIGLSPRNDLVEIHGFSDASERAYAAVIYLRTHNVTETESSVIIVTAKTKVAPLKQVSLPRLELCGATLLAKLAAHVKASLELKDCAIHLWSDSTVTLAWIQGHPVKWKTYVANRVSEIQRAVPDAQWHHVSTKENPADCASRGLPAVELSALDLWWEGPTWLTISTLPWKESCYTPEPEELPEVRLQCHVATEKKEAELWDLLYRYSDLTKLLRITAWCLRFVSKLKSARQPNLAIDCQACYLSPLELDRARLVWVKIVQKNAFPGTISALTRKSKETPDKNLLRLTPILDDNELLRVGGRLKHSLLDPDEKHPLILPSGSYLTEMIIDHYHRQALHGGVQLTLSSLRRRYWILKGRNVVKKHIHRCLSCLKHRAAHSQPMMGNLPEERITPPPRAFYHSGVDYAGPIYVRTTKGRGHKASKAYISVFICLATRAVHLELVSDYTTDSFIAAYRRFVSRRGICATLRSDCSTNFIGADKELKVFFSEESTTLPQLTYHLANLGTKWKFNPPSAPHFGGIWEAAVKSTKHHLKRVLGDATLTFEEMSTLLSQIEACLNSRPLQPISDDPDDITALTPGHFLIGSALTAIPSPSFVDTRTNRLSRWQLVQQMHQQFWYRWSAEYLQTLQSRHKWTRNQNPILENDLVLVRNELTPPTKWPLARVLKLHPGTDGITRVVTLRTATSEIQRPVVKLSLLPRDQASTGD